MIRSGLIPEDMQKAIVDNFLEYLLNKPKSDQNGDYGQGWCECSEFGNCDNPGKKIILKEGIEKYAKLDQAIDKIRNKYGESSVMRTTFIDGPVNHMVDGIRKERL